MHRLGPLFHPKSVAVIGASQRHSRAGYVFMKNLLNSGFEGAIMPVTPKYASVAGILAYRDVASLPLVPDIAILCTNSKRNPELLHALGTKGCPFVIIVSSVYAHDGPQATDLPREYLAIARQYKMRLLGPNSLGIILPWHQFNGAFSPCSAASGRIAFISQSAAVCTTVLDWAQDRNIGFSAFISIGDAIDIDFSELLDYLSMDSKTDAILLYLDSIRDARRFMSAARAAARNRRILVLKGGKTLAGRVATRRQNVQGDTLDIVYDTAISRTGMLRVNNTHELFAAVETLTHSVPLRGERLAIISNGGGPAIMAVDTLIERGGKLAQLDEPLIKHLNGILPAGWCNANPIDMEGDADSRRYVDTLNAVLNSDSADAILIMHSPSAVADSVATARAVITAIQAHPRHQHFNILTNWSGDYTARLAREVLTSAGLPSYRTPESAAVAFMHLVEYRRNQKQLKETPTTAEPLHISDIEQARRWIDHKLGGHNRLTLDTHQLGELFTMFQFNVLPTWIAETPEQAATIAAKIGYPVAVKLRSADIAHKSDVQGVMLNLANQAEVESGARSILERTRSTYPDAHIDGLLVQAMAPLAGCQELRIKVICDATFGPVILLGQGGSEWNPAKEAAAAIPPLNTTLARYLIIRALQNGSLKRQNMAQPLDIEALAQLLVRLSQMVVELPQIHALDIHPLLACQQQFQILDVDMTLTPCPGSGVERLAIRPFPAEFVSATQLKDGESILLRPILPEDEPLHASFIKRVSKEDLYKRFFTEVGEFNHDALANLTQIDYDREMAFVAVSFRSGSAEIIGVSRALINPENSDAEFAILIRSDLKGKGLGTLLMNKIIDYCRSKQTLQMSGITMPANQGMLSLARKLGFTVTLDFEEGSADMVKPLTLPEKED